MRHPLVVREHAAAAVPDGLQVTRHERDRRVPQQLAAIGEHHDAVLVPPPPLGVGPRRDEDAAAAGRRPDHAHVHGPQIGQRPVAITLETAASDAGRGGAPGGQSGGRSEIHRLERRPAPVGDGERERGHDAGIGPHRHLLAAREPAVRGEHAAALQSQRVDATRVRAAHRAGHLHAGQPGRVDADERDAGLGRGHAPPRPRIADGGERGPGHERPERAGHPQDEPPSDASRLAHLTDGKRRAPQWPALAQRSRRIKAWHSCGFEARSSSWRAIAPSMRSRADRSASCSPSSSVRIRRPRAGSSTSGACCGATSTCG